jgi:hypothetical protein
MRGRGGKSAMRAFFQFPGEHYVQVAHPFDMRVITYRLQLNVWQAFH